MNINTVTIIGSGNVASHLGKMLFKANVKINQVYSRTLINATELAEKLNADAITDLSELNSMSDLYVVSVSDDILELVVDKIPFKDKFVVHTAGSLSLGVLEKFSDYGVFYPYQTFTKNVAVKNEIPFCVEANTADNQDILKELAFQISEKVFELNSEQRKQCHLAAVFACNFTNHFYALAENILQKENIPFDVLKPLIFETAEKVRETSPKQAQTGPARRNDQIVIKKHLKELSSEHLEKLYSFVTTSIIDWYKK